MAIDGPLDMPAFNTDLSADGAIAYPRLLPVFISGGSGTSVGD
jgi:hypothetical protein